MIRSALVALAVVACGGGSAPDERPAILGNAIKSGTFEELTAAQSQLAEAMKDISPYSAATVVEMLARVAEVEGLSALLYGSRPIKPAFDPVNPNMAGYRDWVIGVVAVSLTTVKTAKHATELDALLTELGKTHDADPWRRWLVGRVALVRGDRVAAAAAFDASEHRLAKIDRALMLADDGKLEAAEKSIAADDQLLAVLTRAVLRAELGNVAGAVADLELVKSDAPRVVAYRLLATAMIGLANERYDLAADALGKLGKRNDLPNECALWERIAWAHLQLGRSIDKTNDHKIASIARQRCAALGKANGDNKLLTLVDANLNLGLGKPEQAQTLATRVPMAWGAVTLAQAALELGSPQVAVDALAKLPLDAPPTPGTPATPEMARQTAQILMLQARAQLATSKARTDLLAELAALADAAKSQRARHALGAAYFAINDLTAAKRELRRAVEDTSAASPNPLAYRTHQLLAEIGLATGDLVTAGPEIERALEIHPGNAISRVIKGRIHLRDAQPDKALEALAPLRTAGELIPAAKLVAAEALVSRKDATADQRAQAKALISELVGKVQPAELGRVAALVDPQLPRQLKLPVGKPPKQGT